MSAGAVAMLVVSTVIVWGGLLASMIRLRRNPDRSNDGELDRPSDR
jgi:hypothetical protein